MSDLTSTDESAAAPEPIGRLASISIDCSDPAALADFYAALLGMRRVYETPDGRIIAVSDGTSWVTMMRVDGHVATTWPEPGQSKQMHLDVSVTDLPAAAAAAVALGAREADHQAGPDTWRVLIDPAGHPFCLTTVTGD